MITNKTPSVNRTTIFLITLITITLCFLTGPVAAYPAWIDQAIALGSDITPHEDAPVLVLYYTVKVKINSNGSAERTERKVMKVLNSEGTELVFCRDVVDDSRSIKGVKGWRIDDNGKVENLDKHDIVEMDVQESIAYHDDQRAMFAGFQEVKTGDIVAYEYTVKMKEGVDALFQSFVFQLSLPVVYSYFELELPEGWMASYTEKNVEGIQHNVTGNRFVWQLNNMPYRQPEPYMPSWDAVTRSIEVSCYAPGHLNPYDFIDWASVVTWADTLYKSRLATSGNLQTAANDLIANITATTDKARTICEFVRDEIRYVAVEFGLGRFQPRMADLTLSNRYGDCKDKVTLAQAMLKEAGIEAVPVLVHTDQPIDTAFASPFQFNHVILGIPVAQDNGLARYEGAVTGGYLIFDPTDPAMPFGTLPQNLCDAYALPIIRGGSGFVRIPPLRPEKNRRHYIATAYLNDDYSIVAEVRIVDHDLWGHQSAYSRTTDLVDDQLKKMERLFSNIIVNPVIQNYNIDTTDDSTWVTFNLIGQKFVTEAADLCMFRADIFHPGEKTYLKKNKERHHPIDFNVPGVIETTVKWHLAEGWQVSELPDSMSVASPAGEISGWMTRNDSAITFRSYFRYTGQVLPVSEYNEARKFERKQLAINSTRIIFTKP